MVKSHRDLHDAERRQPEKQGQHIFMSLSRLRGLHYVGLVTKFQCEIVSMEITQKDCYSSYFKERNKSMICQQSRREKASLH